MREPVTAYLGLGANLGDPRASLALAVEQLASTPGVTVAAQSAYYRTAPIDSGGPDYTNAVVAVITTLTAPDLLNCLQAIEAGAGRERPYRNAPRTLDLDILLYGSAQVSSARLCIPHPRMWQRAFVLMPLSEIAPQQVTAAQLRTVAGQSIFRLN
nr:2-amino-4-hydroxy-6-hydroxymethyldihydropteridine diphosphokinase [uncultured Rhodoferax sp.]